MGLIPETAFTVRKPAWWDNTGQFDLDYYPGREEAMRLAGHDWDIVEVEDWLKIPNEVLANAGQEVNLNNGGVFRKAHGFKAHLRSDTLGLLHVSRDSFTRIPNSLAYDVAEWVLDNTGFQYQCGISMDDGKQNALTLVLDEPIQVPGDRALIFPLVALSWCHDGTGALKLRSTSIRNECQNTVSASEAEAKAAGTDFTFRHTKNVKERIEEAREAIQGVGPAFDVFEEKMNELAAIEVTPEQRDLFVSAIVGDRDGKVSMSPIASDRVKNHVETERAKVNSLFFGSTIPEAHQLTGYGLHLAGVEYYDHLRAYRSKDSYVRRTLLNDNPAKANLAATIREVALSA
jgi:phage/plasmid-like protein (TIGR03299 family)